MSSGSARSFGRLFAIVLIVLMLGVVAGVIGVGVAAKRQQRYRVTEESANVSSNAPPPVELPARAPVR